MFKNSFYFLHKTLFRYKVNNFQLNQKAVKYRKILSILIFGCNYRKASKKGFDK